MLEQQYIEIFEKYKDIINQYSSPIINSAREEAFQKFKELGIPTKKLETYQKFNASSEFAFDYGLNIKRIPLKGNPYFAFACQVPQIGSNLYYVLNDMYNTTHLPQFEYPKGVFVGGLKDFATEYPEICKKYYNKLTGNDTDGIVAFNTMFAQDGFVIYVPKNTIVEIPIQLVNILKGDFDYLASRRILVIIEENSRAKLLSCDHTVDEKKYLVSQVNEFFIDKNASFEFYELEENSENVTKISSTHIYQDRNSHSNTNTISLQGGQTRNNFFVNLNEEHAEAFVCGLCIEDKDRFVDNSIFIRHNKPNCTSTQLFKYILQDKSIGSFCGRIFVEKDAQKTLAYQSNNNLCISTGAKMYSKPQLEIYADDVKCSHGLTTGQLDEDALFYMRARGINEIQSKLMLMHAFAYDVIEKIHLPALKDKLSDLVEKKLRNEEARCGGCYKCN